MRLTRNIESAILAALLLVGCSDEQKEVSPTSEVVAPAPAAESAAETPRPVEENLGPIVERRIIEVTNIVTVTKTVLITNVINVAESSVERPQALSSRKTAPYIVTCEVMPDENLRRSLSDCGARVISVRPRARAIVEASEKTIEKLRKHNEFHVRVMDPFDKVGTGADGAVLIYPLSSIDEQAVSAAVEAMGAEPRTDRLEGRSVIRAKLTGSQVMELAARGDVRRIERDVEK